MEIKGCTGKMNEERTGLLFRQTDRIRDHL